MRLQHLAESCKSGPDRARDPKHQSRHQDVTFSVRTMRGPLGFLVCMTIGGVGFRPCMDVKVCVLHENVQCSKRNRGQLKYCNCNTLISSSVWKPKQVSCLLKAVCFFAWQMFPNRSSNCYTMFSFSLLVPGLVGINRSEISAILRSYKYWSRKQRDIQRWICTTRLGQTHK